MTPESGKSATLSGTTTVAFNQGSCVFSNLTIAGLGTHELEFQLVKPDGITMTPITLTAKITPKKEPVESGGVEIGVIVGVAVALVLLIAALGGGVYYWKRRQGLESAKSGSTNKAETMDANVYENIPAQTTENESHPDKPPATAADSHLPTPSS